MFPLTTRAIQKQLAIVCEYLGYEGISTHSFRKWYATEIYRNNGYDIALVQRFLQHSSASITQRYIGIEQMDYIENITTARLIAVIKGIDKKGISKSVDWQGGGSFVYCELAKLNQAFVDEIEVAKDEKTLSDIYKRIMKSGFISYKANPTTIDEAADDYKALSLEDKKRFLMEILDKNLLYVNYCDMDDEEYGISEEDKAFTRSFYREQ